MWYYILGDLLIIRFYIIYAMIRDMSVCPECQCVTLTKYINIRTSYAILNRI